MPSVPELVDLHNLDGESHDAEDRDHGDGVVIGAEDAIREAHEESQRSGDQDESDEDAADG